MYILTEQLESATDATRVLQDYHAYLDSVAERFPQRAFELAKSQWYHDFTDHRCPHDAWLEELVVREVGSGPRQAVRFAAITIRLLGAYHDGQIELRYDDATRYECHFLQAQGSMLAHADWRYDEFRLAESGRVIHEIEWSHMDETARWVIEAADVTFSWKPFEILPAAPNER